MDPDLEVLLRTGKDFCDDVIQSLPFTGGETEEGQQVGLQTQVSRLLAQCFSLALQLPLRIKTGINKIATAPGQLLRGLC